MNSLEMQCVTILQAAASAEYGIVLKTNDPAKARATLYRVRKDLGDTELAKLMIRVSPDDSEGELWIIRNASHMLDLKATEIV